MKTKIKAFLFWHNAFEFGVQAMSRTVDFIILWTCLVLACAWFYIEVAT